MKNKYFKRTAIFILSACTIILLTSCSKKDKNGLTSSEYLLVGDQISKHNQAAGVIQVSPGTKDNPTSEGIFDIPESKSLLRFKLFDDPIENPETNGLVKVILLSSEINSALAGSALKKFNPEDITIELNVEKISVLEEKSLPKKDIKDRTKYFYPTIDDGRIYFNERRIYTMAVKGISLLEGDYISISVHFKRDGKLYHKGEIHPLRLAKKIVKYDKTFSVEKGKITTLSLISSKDKIKDIIKKRLNFNNKEFICWSHHWSLFKKRKDIAFLPLTLRLFIPYDATIHKPVSQIFIRFSQLSAVNSNGDTIILNDQETEFELLSLRSGAVALMGSNAVDAGEYKYFELELGTDHHVVINGDSYPLTIEDWSYDTLRFMGPFDLRGGRITEVFLHFDPNKSLFYIRGQGFIMEPDIMITSTISMTPVQEFRLVESLGKYSNTVMSQTELAFQGTVISVTPTLADNIYGKKMIYSDVVLSVEDRLRGVLDDTGQYSLRVIGGSHNGIGLKVPGMPEFSTEEKVLLFLRDYSGRMSAIHGDYGKIVIE